MTEKTRRALQIGISLGLSALFLYLAFRGEDWGKTKEALAEAQPGYLLLMVPIGVFALYVRCIRWKLILESAAGKSVPMMPVFSASAIGFMANMVLPLRIGEIARPYLLSRSTDVSVSMAIATVVVERVLDLLILVLFALFVLVSADVPPAVEKMSWLAAGIGSFALVCAMLVTTQRERFVPILDRIWKMLPPVIGARILALEHEFLDGCEPISRPAVFAKALGWSAATWGVIVTGFAVGFPAMDLQVPFAAGGVAVTTIVALAVSVPSAPAFVGQFEWGCKLALEQMYSVPGPLALGYAVLVHVMQFSTQVVMGLVFLLREGLSFRDLGSFEANADDTSSRDAPPAGG